MKTFLGAFLGAAAVTWIWKVFELIAEIEQVIDDYDAQVRSFSRTYRGQDS